MSDFLLELLSEEIPARMQAKARNDLARMFGEALAAAGLKHDGIITYSTPRRLALIAKGLPAATEAASEELKGPKTSAPQQALDGFLRKTGLTQDQLEDRGGVWFASIDKPGRASVDVLAQVVAGIVAGFAWPKSMRWGDASTSPSSLRWVRPLHSIVALLGAKIVPVAIDGVACGASTLGHRFHHPGQITIGGAHDYVEKLRACHVLVDHAEREAIIRDGAKAAAEKAGFSLVEDEGLVVENAGLTEWPVPLLGSFDADYLDVPEEVIALTARINQKYFVMRDAAGKLAPHFVCTANIDANDGGAAIIAGNERVLAARLSDARFFWEHDVKVPLEEQAKKLEQIVFHEKLGTVADKVERVAKLARWLVEEGIVPGTLSPAGRDEQARHAPDMAEDVRGTSAPVHGEGAPTSSASAEPPHPNPLPAGEREQLADLAECAARLAKADLVTGMVGEFPELQGVIGGYLARAQGEPDAIADAIRDHYKPVGQGDEVPTAPVTVAVSLADKLDSVSAFFAIDEKPTGSKDPFALRRAALAAIALICGNGLRISLRSSLQFATIGILNRQRNEAAQLDLNSIMEALKRQRVGNAVGEELTDEVYLGSMKKAIEDYKALIPIAASATDDLLAFLADRLKVQQREAGIRHDLIDAVLSLGGEDDLVRLLARVTALQAFVETGEGANLLAGYKRATNILKKETWDKSLAHDDQILPEERALDEALGGVEPTARVSIEREQFGDAMIALAALRAPIDAFFDGVTVNATDIGVRARRLNLLARFRDAVHRVADFSKIEG